MSQLNSRSAVAAPSVRIPLDFCGASLEWSPPAGCVATQGALLVVPGAGCRALGYRWLATLAHVAGFGCAWLDVQPAVPGEPAMASIRAVVAAEAALQRQFGRDGGRLWAIGHSWGGGVLLECLDPVEARHNPRSEAPPRFAGLACFEAVATLGTTLQPHVAGMHLRHRDADRPLARPAGTRLLFIAAGRDDLATASLVQATADRYSPPARVEVVPGANHFGWVHDDASGPRPAWDRAAELSRSQQAEQTLVLLEEFFR